MVHKKVLLEVGHGPHAGGFETGAQFGLYNEYVLNWVAAIEAKRTLSNSFSSLEMQVDITDYAGSLWQVGQQARGYDIFISIHHNAFNGSAQGAEAFTHTRKGSPDDEALAKMIASAMALAVGVTDRGAKKANFGVLSGAEDANYHYRNESAQILAECYFGDAMANTGADLFDKSKKAGAGIASAIAAFVKG